jgi:hypothetical protein
VALGLVGVVAGAVVGGCGPSLPAVGQGGSGSSGDVDPEILEPEPWMIGVFSNKVPGTYDDGGQVTQLHMYDTLDCEVVQFNYGHEAWRRWRRWEPQGLDSFLMYRGEDDVNPDANRWWEVRPREDATATCGPWELVSVSGPGTTNEGREVVEHPPFIRGEVCPERRPDGCDPELIECEPWIFVWCDGEPPPPCEE